MSKPRKVQDRSPLLSRFKNDKRGNFAMLLGLSILPLITFFGAAVDYSRVTSAKASLNSASDAAALNAVTQAINSNNGMGAQPTGYVTNPTGTMPTTANVRGFFDGASRDSQYIGAGSFDPASPSIPAGAPFTYSLFYTGPTGTCPTAMPGGTTTSSSSTPCTPNSYIATISYSGQIPTTILQVVGINQMTIHGTATAQSKLPSYLNFYVLMDNSPSMGIAGSTKDIANMQALTAPYEAQNSNPPCAFACHEHNSDGSDDVNDYFHLALANGVKTRIDYLRSAVGNLLTLASTTQQVPNQFQFGLYTFSNTATQTTVSALSTNFTQLQTDTQNIQLGYDSSYNSDMNQPGPYVPSGPDEETDIDAGMNFVGSNVSASFTSPRAPTNFVVLVSDGVQDKTDCSTAGTTSGGCRAYEPVSLATCNSLKTAGNQVAVVYTPYLPLTNNYWYNTYVAPINIQPVPTSASLPQIANVMQSCASDPSLFVETSPTTDIGTALQTIFQNALSRTLLTN